MIHGASDVRQALFRKAIHEEWISNYESGLNDAFYELAIDSILSRLSVGENSLVLDAGCGNAAKSIRLAARGMRVIAVDFSPAVLGLAKKNIENSAFVNSIDLRQEDLCSLSFEDNAFDAVICWGVLMHIPQVKLLCKNLLGLQERNVFL